MQKITLHLTINDDAAITFVIHALLNIMGTNKEMFVLSFCQ